MRPERSSPSCVRSDGPNKQKRSESELNQPRELSESLE